ncbi:S8 family peptidase [Allorhizocola rhizosphaerae]|uniref:S8 family peptidase n=1 Tax=Allorhizocola rhizosphaerae TaxID=1872709 RepID=UPI000E3BD92F|nr:S8 family peptidase [Allorhizocola rhizosphaerae]
MMKRIAVAACLGLVFFAGTPANSAPKPELGEILNAGAPNAVPGSYIVVMKPGISTMDVSTFGAATQYTYTTALKGFAVKATEQQAKRIAGDKRVDFVVQDQTVSINVNVQSPVPSWGLDRIDERSLPLDNKYHFPSVANSVKAYIIDTGIRFTHQEFGGRAVLGIDTVGDGQNGNDCNGHGTHVAGTVGGRSVGVAKGVRLVAVRVLNCGGGGTFAGVIAGVDWVTADALLSPSVRSVANMSLGAVGANAALELAVTTSIAANVHYSIAAGNSNLDACGFTPARTPRATTVGATDISDNRAAFSNFGPCVDLFAPGVNIYSAWSTADNAYNTISGTSMAAPHAAGTAALWRHRFPADNADVVAAALVANATPGVVVNPGAGSPNLLLFMGMVPM